MRCTAGVSATPGWQTFTTQRAFGARAPARDAWVDECVAVEEPLEIRVRGVGDDGPFRETLAVTMRTPGDDAALATGFLCSEGVVQRASDVCDVDARGNVVEVTLSAAASRVYGEVAQRFVRHGVVSASCGVCGKKSLAAVRVRQRTQVSSHNLRVTPAMLQSMGERVRGAQPLFDVTGGIHAAAWFDGAGHLMALREDVGRHNALDKLIGTAIMGDAVPLHDSIVWVSGRTSFELVQKAALACVPMLVSVGAPSSLAVELARTSNMTLVGFLRGARFNVYAGASRIGTPT